MGLVDFARHGVTSRIRLAGDIDLNAERVLRTASATDAETGSSRLAVNMGAVSFLDQPASAGVSTCTCDAASRGEKKVL